MNNIAEMWQKMRSANVPETHAVDNNDTVLFIDGMNSFIRCFAASKTMNDHGQHVGGITSFLLSIGELIRMTRPTRVVIIFDGQGGSQRRRTLYKDYKENRKTMTKLNRQYEFATIEDEHESRKWQLLTLVRILRTLPVTVMSPDNVEADDVIAYLAQHNVEQGHKSIISSSDKDFLQLVNDDTLWVWNPIKKKMYKPANIVEDYGFHPRNFLLFRVLSGDSSDNISGVAGFAEKTVLKYFPELAEADQKTPEFLFESAARQVAEKKKSPVALTTLLQSKDVVKRNMQLMRLDEVSMSGTARVNALNAFNRPPNKLNKHEFMQQANDNAYLRSFGMFDAWFQNSFVPLTRYMLNDK